MRRGVDFARTFIHHGVSPRGLTAIALACNDQCVHGWMDEHHQHGAVSGGLFEGNLSTFDGVRARLLVNVIYMRRIYICFFAGRNSV
jgi:hypothetical protein